EFADVLYKTTDYYAPQYERSILWNDPTLAIAWPLVSKMPVLSKKDQQAQLFSSAEVFEA
ncbi:MAG: dTDP-4-keto-6-deoxy-D-glucose epimerase, partial [Symploca sp. SIO2G7]|nr:dTDP-4-keto-6-deoxy-D-glucose epimerase [Symploca sp. SIO2G7]